MHDTLIQRMRARRRALRNARSRAAPSKRQARDPLAIARGLMNAFALSILVWILIALGVVWVS